MVELLTVIALICIFRYVWRKPLGRFIIGNLVKIIYCGIAVTMCMAIPIPILNVLLAIWVVGGILGSEIG